MEKNLSLRLTELVISNSKTHYYMLTRVVDTNWCSPFSRLATCCFLLKCSHVDVTFCDGEFSVPSTITIDS